MSAPEELDACPNCGSARSGRFCAACGQDSRHERLVTGAILKDAVSDFVGWEARLWRTLRGLVRDPGGLVSDFVAGKRQPYVNPVRFCLFSLALWLLTARLFAVDPTDLRMEVTPGDDASVATQLAVETMVEDVRGIVQRHLNLFLFLSLPSLGLIVRFLFRGRRNLAEVLVFVLFLEGAHYLFSLLMVPVSRWSPGLAGACRLAFVLIWSVRAARPFFGVGTLAALWRMLLAKFLHILVTTLLILLVAVPVALARLG